MDNPTYRLGLLVVAPGLTLARPAASSAQNLYAASYSNSVVSYAPGSTATQFASLSNVYGLAFQAAVLAGAGLLGFVTLRQRRPVRLA